MPSPENHLPAPAPTLSSLLCKIGWIMALVTGLLAALLASRYFALSSTVKLLGTEAELNRIEVQSLQQQLEAERIIAARQIANLSAKPSAEPMLFAHLLSHEPGNTSLSAIVAWQPSNHTGIFFSEQLPPNAPDEEYRLWIEAGNGVALNAGALSIDPNSSAKVEFKTAQAIGQPTRFTVTRERKGNLTSPAGQIVLSGAP